jgi:hypothetical protein
MCLPVLFEDCGRDEIESAKPALLAPVAVGVAHSSERLLETGATLQQRTKL